MKHAQELTSKSTPLQTAKALLADAVEAVMNNGETLQDKVTFKVTEIKRAKIQNQLNIVGARLLKKCGTGD